jgi:anthranilate synthase
MVPKPQQQVQYRCRSGMTVRRTVSAVEYRTASSQLARALNSRKGVLLASGFEYPGRYSRWDIGFVNPPLQLTGRGRSLQIEALNQRGQILLPEIREALADLEQVELLAEDSSGLELHIPESREPVSEEMRSRQASLFTALRAIVAHFYSPEDHYLGLYGAFGYDLTFQFEDVQRYQKRATDQRDLLLYLPDEITVTDHRSEQSFCYRYEFVCRAADSGRRTETTGGFKRSGSDQAFVAADGQQSHCDHEPGEFAQQVRRAIDYFRRGDLFEVVPGQTFFEPCVDTPADIFTRLQESNPAPYGALMNLGEQEYLVAASPEMFVRVDGRQIETCPISGTIARGEDAIGDARQIRELLNSEKDESELSMCTDVDRNDKARVCEPGSVEVVGRRQIELYSRLIHTVDHVKGVLKQGFDALDGFLAHTWAVTVTGAPKLAAMQYIERFEKSPRHWYGGAMGHIGFDGNLNTGLTLRTVRIKDGVAQIRAGATLLFDSDPEAEEAETRLKASALVQAVRGVQQDAAAESGSGEALPGKGLRVLMVDHQDSFVHNLASYFRSCGAELLTLRPEAARQYIGQQELDLVVLSPGPSQPRDFAMAETIEAALAAGLPLFGVCLGLQGIVEYFGGSLATLDYPVHGKPSRIRHEGSALFEGLANSFTAGRYHSLVAREVPRCLRVTARSADFQVMAVEHEQLAVAAVQFHPESIMSLEAGAGMRLITNVLNQLVLKRSRSEKLAV